MSKIAYADKVENGGTTIAGQARAVDMNEIKVSVNDLYDEVPYKSYVALLSQSGTAAPTATILQNTTGLTFGLSRTQEGDYSITPSVAPNQNKVAILVGAGFMFPTYGGSIIYLATKLDTGFGSDGMLLRSAIEVRIYP